MEGPEYGAYIPSATAVLIDPTNTGEYVKRKPNFTDRENLYVVDQVIKNKDTILNKQVNGRINSKKHAIWHGISVVLNKHNSGVKRYIGDVRRKWKNLLHTARRELILYKNAEGSGMIRLPSPVSMKIINAGMVGKQYMNLITDSQSSQSAILCESDVVMPDESGPITEDIKHEQNDDDEDDDQNIFAPMNLCRAVEDDESANQIMPKIVSVQSVYTGESFSDGEDSISDAELNPPSLSTSATQHPTSQNPATITKPVDSKAAVIASVIAQSRRFPVLKNLISSAVQTTCEYPPAKKRRTSDAFSQVSQANFSSHESGEVVETADDRSVTRSKPAGPTAHSIQANSFIDASSQTQRIINTDDDTNTSSSTSSSSLSPRHEDNQLLQLRKQVLNVEKEKHILEKEKIELEKEKLKWQIEYWKNQVKLQKSVETCDE